MTKNVVRVVWMAGCAMIAAGAYTEAAHAFKGQQMASQTKVNITQARQIAQSAQPGTITDGELEREAGGSGLRYSFDIKNGSVTHEVGVGAETGKVLENSAERPHGD